MKKEFKVIIREVVGIDTINFSKVAVFRSEDSAKEYFYSKIGAFLYSIDDIYDIYKCETDNKMQLDIFCRGFVRNFILIY